MSGRSRELSGRTISGGLTFALLILLTCVEAFAGHATILLYHRFGDARYPTTSVSMEEFERQMRYLKENGYRVVRLSTLVDTLKRGEEVPPKTVAITIDDGYRSTMKAYEVLRRYGYPFTVFLYMEAVGRYPDFLTLEQIRKMELSGLAEFENHSYSHGAFGLFKDTTAFVEDLERSEKRFLKLFGRKPRFYALPFGFYNRRVIEILRERGYTAVFTQDPGNVGEGTDLFRIPRQAIVGSWSRMENFPKKLGREPLPLRRLIPGYGFLSKNPPGMVGGELSFPERFGNCRIYVTELGWKRASRRGALVFRRVEEKLRRKWNRIGIKCRDTASGRWAESFWTVIR